MVEYHKITEDGMKTLKAEKVLLEAERPHKIKALAAARALGDLSENAEYSTAKYELHHLEGRLRYLDKVIRYGQVVSEDPKPIADLGKTVTVRFDDDEDVTTFRLVGPHEASMKPGNLAVNSPLGRALNGRKVGETVTVQAPSGSYQVTVVKLA